MEIDKYSLTLLRINGLTLAQTAYIERQNVISSAGKDNTLKPNRIMGRIP
jgi:hypothetical protein